MELIVISDLHLSTGYNEDSGRFSRNEDFFFDEEFRRFLRYLQKENPSNNHLVINGDMFDFLQVAAGGKEFENYLKKTGLPFEPTGRELKFGFGTEEDKTVWKLEVIAGGHEVFFRALAEFLSEENRLSIISGNHDVELYWPEVQKILKEQIDRYKTGGTPITNPVDFYPWFYYDKEHKTYIEHGNQYDRLNSFHYLLCPLLKQGSGILWLPFGSFFVRYFFNKLEISNPFADNIKPPTRFMQWIWNENKLQFLKNIFHYIPTMCGVFMKGGGLPKAEKEHLEKQNEKELGKLAENFKLPLNDVKKIYSSMTLPLTRMDLLNILTYSTFSFFVIASVISIILLAVFMIGFKLTFWAALLRSLSSFGILIVPLIKWIFKLSNKDIFEKALPAIKASIKDVRTIVFGHTHDPDIRTVSDDCRYFNTGTWTTVFSEDERIIREAKQFSFVWVRKKDGTPQADLYRWNDCLNQPERQILFE